MSASTTQDVPYPHADESLGEKLQPDEAHIATEIADDIEATIRKQYQEGDARRDVHSKATGVLRAQFKVNENIPAIYAKGIFIPGKTYEAVIRLSNAGSNPHQTDNHEDGRGFAIKLLDVPGPKLLETDKNATTQDFLLINSPIFMTNDIRAYHSLLQKANGTFLQKLTIPLSLGLRGTLIAGKMVSGKVSNPLQIQYFGVVPYQLGLGPESEVVKFSIKPATDEHDPMPEHLTDDYLHEAIKKKLAAKEVQYRFLIQRRTSAHMDVEDSTREWSQEESPYVEVGTVRIPQQDVDADNHNLDKLGERLSFNPWHTIPEIRPMGGIMRMRKVIYERISRVRDSMNHVPREEPTSV
ncbi:hypothetical protein BGW38_000834 [Lunasporangiospora selenospora]|uniref:Catalase core domain-containing protein n=1 Tax=Lunasporangiospora selenospora TaxID=979761 RepID=A0A9P6KEP6_9FUNG|nr:hypothetical protein BGW38_000834 [Lunasporangiospora selenospora]